MKKTIAKSNEKYWRLEKVLEFIPVSRMSIYSWIKNGTFPAPKKLGSSALFDVDEILKWQKYVTEYGSSDGWSEYYQSKKSSGSNKIIL